MTTVWTQGERVAVCSRRGGKATEILVVAHVGTLEVKTTDGRRWLTRSGDQRGGGDAHIRKLRPEDERDAAEAPILRAIEREERGLFEHTANAEMYRREAASLEEVANEKRARSANRDGAAQIVKARLADLRAKLTPGRP